MDNNWICRPERKVNTGMVFDACDIERIHIGDEIESELTRQDGVVLGVIRNKYYGAVCYKVWHSPMEDGDKGCFDYIPADKVTMVERCDDAEWLLSRIGYKWVSSVTGDDTIEYMYNEETGDMLFW